MSGVRRKDEDGDEEEDDDDDAAKRDAKREAKKKEKYKTANHNVGHIVVQKYLERPLLLDGFKFDLRVYCLITSIDPFRMFVFKDGLVRLSTTQYEKPNEDNMAERCMHLTNYAINKESGNFKADGEGALI
jgi:hypothetical protein